VIDVAKSIFELSFIILVNLPSALDKRTKSFTVPQRTTERRTPWRSVGSSLRHVAICDLNALVDAEKIEKACAAQDQEHPNQ